MKAIVVVVDTEVKSVTLVNDEEAERKLLEARAVQYGMTPEDYAFEERSFGVIGTNEEIINRQYEDRLKNDSYPIIVELVNVE